MKDYKKITQVFDLFIDSVEIGEKSPFFSISITPHDESMRLLCWLESNSDLLQKIESVYRIKFIPDESNDLCAEFNINNVLIHIAFCI